PLLPPVTTATLPVRSNIRAGVCIGVSSFVSFVCEVLGWRVDSRSILGGVVSQPGRRDPARRPGLWRVALLPACPAVQLARDRSARRRRGTALAVRVGAHRASPLCVIGPGWLGQAKGLRVRACGLLVPSATAPETLLESGDDG